MNEPMSQRAWTLPTVHQASRALAPLAVFALLLAIPALPGGAVLVSGAHPTLAAPMAATVAGTTVSPTPSTGLHVAPLSYRGLGTAALPFQPSAHDQVAALARAHLLNPVPAQSTGANFELTGSDCASYGVVPAIYQFPFSFAGTAIASPAGHNTTVDVAGGLATPMFDGPGGVNCTTISYASTFASTGFLAVFHSTDGGHTFSQTWVPANTTHWGTSSDPSYGGVNWGQPSIATGPNDSVMVADVYANGMCQVQYFTNTSGCSNATGFENDWGVAVSTSTDGGATFGDAVQISAQRGITYYNMGTCTAPASGFYINHVPETPTLSVDPANGHAILTWDVYYTTADAATCTITANAQVYQSISTDGGVTWSTPKALSAALSESASVAYGAGTGPEITSVFDDFANQSTGISIAMARSTNGGTSWSVPADVGGTGIEDLSGQVQYPDAFFAPTLLTLAADTGATSPYLGHQYVVWSDNQTGTSYAGYDAIRLLTATGNGSTWASSYTTLTAATSSYSYFEPAISVAPNGDVWVTYYGISTSSGVYNLYGVLSTDGGATWSAQFPITDSGSAPGSSVYDIGSRTGVVATTNGAYPSWTDCRASSCSTNGDVLDFDANVQRVTVAATPGAIQAQVTTAGITSTVTTPTTLGWDNVSSHSVSVPQYVPDTANTSDVWGFTGYSGLNTSSAFTTTFTYNGGGGTLMADYSPLPAAIIKGNFTPNSASDSLKLNGQAVPLTSHNATALQYSVTVASGIAYTFTASAGTKYQSVTNTVFTTSGGGTYYNNYDLQKSNGSFKGTLTPANALLTINGTAVTNVSAATGAFNVPEPWGWYWVNASGQGLTGFSEYLEVNPAVITTVNPTLFGGWIAGTVSLGGKTVPGLVVKVDNTPVTVTVPSYTFNQTVLGGFHNITATAPGYNLSTLSDVYVTPGSATSLSITLTNQGWLTGQVSPAAALSKVQLHITVKGGTSGNYYPVSGVTGAFNVSVLGNTQYVVNVSASGYKSFQSDFNVTPGNATPVSVSLTPAPSGCTGSNCPQQNCTVTNTCPPPPGGTGTNGNGFPTTDLIIIVVVIVLVAVVAAVLLMRGRSGGGGEPAEYDEGPAGTYQDTSTSALPKLQSDGSMGGPPPPPPP